MELKVMSLRDLMEMKPKSHAYYSTITECETISRDERTLLELEDMRQHYGEIARWKSGDTERINVFFEKDELENNKVYSSESGGFSTFSVQLGEDILSKFITFLKTQAIFPKIFDKDFKPEKGYFYTYTWGKVEVKSQ